MMSEQNIDVSEIIIKQVACNECALIRKESETYDHIYEAHRRREIEKKIRSKIVYMVAMLFAIVAPVIIGVLQYNLFIDAAKLASNNSSQNSINHSKYLCNKLSIKQIDLLPIPIAAALVILYILLYKRRVFLRNRFRYRNVGVPMIVSCWNKTDRLFSSYTYGLIAFSVFIIAKTSFETKNFKLINVSDPSGLIYLFSQVVQMLVVGIRYYPVLVAYRSNTFIIDVTCAIYMWIDFGSNVYHYSLCDTDQDAATHKVTSYIVYKVLFAIPWSFFSAFLTITLSYKSWVNLKDFLCRFKCPNERMVLKCKNRDNIFCLIANVDDDHEIIYSSSDFEYVMQLFDKKSSSSKNDVEKTDTNKEKHIGCELAAEKSHSTILGKLFGKVKHNSRQIFKTFIYPHDPTFRFSARFCRAVSVAIVSLYYIFLYWAFLVGWLGTNANEIVKHYSNLTILKIGNVTSGIIQLNILDVVCALNITNESCDDKMTFLSNSYFALFFVPIWFALVISLVQVFLLVKESRKILKNMYRGKFEFVKRAEQLNKSFIASSSFHFGGYLVGYLIWGFVIIYMFGLLIGLIIVSMGFFSGHRVFGYVMQKLVPVITVVVIKSIVNYIASTYVFLDRKSKILALNNFRAYNVFLYFNFFLDCFMGIISAIIRLIKSIVVAIIMMPRISYSFMGRQFENYDTGYSCYRGFLHMESMHTNPIIICFCSILFYKDYLNEYLHHYKNMRREHKGKCSIDHPSIIANLEKTVNMKFYLAQQNRLKKLREASSMATKLVASRDTIDVPTYDEATSSSNKSNYKNKRVLNRWHLFVMLSRNPDIIKFRKYNFINKRTGEKGTPKEDVGFLEKLKNKFTKIFAKNPEKQESVKA